MFEKIKANASSMIGWPTISDSACWIAAMARAVSPFRRRFGRTETFRGALVRLDTDAATVAKNQHNFTIMSGVHVVATVGGLLMVGRAIVMHGGGGFGWFGFAAFNGACAFTFAFRAWQIATGRLGSVAEFVAAISGRRQT